MSSIIVTPYCKELEQKHIEFASQYWTKKRRKEPAYIYWKFRGNPNEELNSFILAIDKDKVVGQLGLIPCKINIDGEVYHTQWACDLMVDKEYRGMNIANLLYDYAHKLKPITLGSDPSPAASKSMKKKGYQSLKSSYKHIFALKIGELSKLKNYQNKFLDFLYNPFLLFYLVINKISRNKFETVDKSSYKSLKPKKTNKIKVVRDEEFISWRFYPFNGFYPGIEIKSQKNKEIFYLGYFSSSTYFITDFNIKNIFHLFQIISDITNRFKSKGLLRIRFSNNNINLSKWLSFFGIIKFRTQTEIIFHTEDKDLEKKITNNVFYYTYMDSDENI